MTRRSGLPAFRKPPVTEVVVAVSFRELTQLTAPRMGEFWHTKLKEHFPRTEEQPPYNPPTELFGPARPGSVLIQLATGFPTSRVWCLTNDGQELLQFQRDWFACNWRKVKPDDEYGRWPERRLAFERWFREFELFVSTAEMGSVEPIQYEVTYVNHILPAPPVWERFGQLPRVMRLAGVPSEGFLPEPEQTQLTTQFVVPPASEGGNPSRLHISVQPALRAEDGVPMWVVNLTCRGRPEAADLDSILNSFDRASEWIVEAFAAITTPEMHEVWDRYA